MGYEVLHRYKRLLQFTCSRFIMLELLMVPQLMCSWWMVRKKGLHLVNSRPRLKAGAWSPGCSLQGILGYGEACRSPGRGPGSPPLPEESGPCFAGSQRTDGCDSSVHVRYDSSHLQASGCGARQVNGLLSCCCCFGFFGPV